MFSRAYWWGGVLASWGVPALVSAPTPPALEQRRCESRILPTDGDAAPPRLGRLPVVPERGWAQTAFQIPAASTAENPGRDPADLGDSGKVASAQTLPGVSAGRPLAAAPVPSAPALTLSVYATAGDVLQHLAPPTARAAALARLRALRVSRVFLEGRRGDEYVPPATLAEVRDFLAAQGLASAGGIATVPGANFGVRQNEGLGWLNWEAEKTRRDVAQFFAENAAVFDTLIVDDFFCTGDTSPASAAVTPALLRWAGPTAQRLAGVKVGPAAKPAEVTRVRVGARHHGLPRPLEVDGSLAAGTARVRLLGAVAGGMPVPLLTEQGAGRGRLLVLNLRTFDEADLRAAGEWLLCPKPLGWSELPAPVAGAVREALLAPLRVRFAAPAGVALYLWDEGACLYNFHDAAVRVRFNGRALDLPPHGPYWVERPGPARRPAATASEGDFHGAGRHR